MKKKRKRKCRAFPYSKCGDEPWWFAPFYGKGDGSPSGATMPPWQKPLTNAPGAGPKSGAYPGAGGINSPSVPAGANSGMGPVHAGLEISGKGIMEDLMLMARLESEHRDYEAQTAEWSQALGEPLKWVPDLNHEADSRPRFIAVGPKFYQLPNDEARRGVLYHEFAHFKRLDMEALADNALWDMVAAGAFGKQRATGEVDGINGQTTPGENVVEAYSVLIMEPNWLKAKYPQAYEYVRGLASKLGLPLKPWIKK